MVLFIEYCCSSSIFLQNHFCVRYRAPKVISTHPYEAKNMVYLYLIMGRGRDSATDLQARAQSIVATNYIRLRVGLFSSETQNEMMQWEEQASSRALCDSPI